MPRVGVRKNQAAGQIIDSAVSARRTADKPTRWRHVSGKFFLAIVPVILIPSSQRWP
jgi:hypothetical protein